MNRFLAVAFLALVLSRPASADAGQLGGQIPSNCVAHTGFDGGPDFIDDYRCAGLAIEFHTAGVAFSPGPIWAGQWLFVDEEGKFRVGSCTFNRGIHPTIDTRSSVVPQRFPNDPTGAKGAYLTWRYGDTVDNLTAAAMWAVFHFYAQDSAGTNRAANGSVPLVPSLGMVARASGRADIQALAIALDAEATRFAVQWTLTTTMTTDGTIEARLAAGGQPVADATITLLVSGQDAPTTAPTDAAGVARATVSVAQETTTVVASTPTPGLALVYRGTPAGPDLHGAQNLVTGGAPRIVSAMATIDVAIPPTSTSTTTTTTTTLPPTTISTTTSMTSTTTTTTTTAPPPSTTSTTSTTSPPTTTTTTTSTTLPSTAAEVLPTTLAPAATAPTAPSSTEAVTAVVPAPLPKTGSGSGPISYLGTSLLVGGIGVVGVASRRSIHVRRRLRSML